MHKKTVVKSHLNIGWPLSWKSGKCQGKGRRTKIVREKSGNLRKRGKSGKIS